MRKKSPDNQSRNTLRLLVIFCVFVLVAISASLGYRLYNLITTSRVDGVEKITVAFIHDNDVTLLGVDTKTKSASQVKVTGEGSAKEKLETLAIRPEGTVSLNDDDTSFVKLSGIFWQAFFKRDSTSSTFSSYDTFRLALLFQGVAASTVEIEELHLPGEIDKLDNQVQLLLSDDKINDENKSIAVINATGVPGLGRYIERIIANRGGNIIEVSNAESIQETSVIRNNGEKNYTSRRLSSLLQMPVEDTKRQDLSDIMVVIGKDAINKF